MKRLTERRERILDFIVREYVDTATPVSSKITVERQDLGVSSATVRSEMAQLESQGYLTQPHTSAGRMPTAMGYRYFVEYLMEKRALALSERRMIEHQFHQVDMEPMQWTKLAAAILTKRAGTASLVTAPRARRCRFQHLELARVGETNVLLSLVLQEGTMMQRIISTEGIRVPDTLHTLANELNTLLRDLNAEEVRGKASQLKPAQKHVGDHVAELMDDADLRHNLELYRYGFAHILRQPEFAKTEKLEEVVSILEQPGHLESILAEIGLSRSGVQVVIGDEERWPQLSDFSLVVSRYGQAWQTAGLVGVMGPIRMPYSRNIPMVSFMADLMSKLVRGWHSS